MNTRRAMWKARMALAVGRWLMRFPDPTIVRLLGVTAAFLRLGGAGPVEIRSVNEVKAIFVAGKPGTTIVRRMLRDGDPVRLRMIVRGAFLK
ncbi:MAG: hypothetical protein IT350_08410 [Deltaproteobacteria bacterium]|nr:hypothetical protein [Deltaproteobacteria bacterium]